MHCSDTSRGVRGVSLAVAQRRLAEIARIARDSQNPDSLCHHWPADRFEVIEWLALEILKSPPANLSAIALDQLQALREALGDDMGRVSEALEDVYTKPDWRVAYLAYFIPFSCGVLDDLAHSRQTCSAAMGAARTDR